MPITGHHREPAAGKSTYHKTLIGEAARGISRSHIGNSSAGPHYVIFFTSAPISTHICTKCKKNQKISHKQRHANKSFEGKGERGRGNFYKSSLFPVNYLLNILSLISFTRPATTSFVFISSLILSRACIMVVWSRPPKYSPMDTRGTLCPSMSQIR